MCTLYTAIDRALCYVQSSEQSRRCRPICTNTVSNATHTYQIGNFQRKWQQEAQLMLTAPSDSLFLGRRVQIYLLLTYLQTRATRLEVSQAKHNTSPYIRYSYLLVWNSNFVFKTRRFSNIRLQKWRDLEIRTRVHSRSLKVEPFDRLGVVFS